MKCLRTLLLCAIGLGGSMCTALARGWEAPSYDVNVVYASTDDAFPGSVNTGPDQRMEPRVELATANRLSQHWKLGLSALAGGNVQQEFTRANYGWFGAGANARYRSTTWTLEGEYTPSRNKFPADPEEGGAYRGWEVVGGMRQNLGKRARARLEARLDREDFHSELIEAAGRNSRGREWRGRLDVAPARGVDLRTFATLARDETESRKYRKDFRTFGVGMAWSDSLWRADAGAESGVRRYPDAIDGDSNFERRDQWIDVALRLTRRVSHGFALWVGGELVNQTSNRLDKNFQVHTLRFGCEWAGGGR